MKNEGITILQIVITIIIMLLLVLITFLAGQNVTGEAKIAVVYNEIKEIKSALQEAYLMDYIRASGDKLFIGDYEASLVSKVEYPKELENEDDEKYYYLDFTSSKDLAEFLELEEVQNDYLFDFVNLNIYLVGGIEVPTSDNETTVEYNSNEIEKYYKNVFVK